MNYKFEKEKTERLDVYLSTVTDLSRSSVQKLVQGEKIKVNGQTVKSNYKLNYNDIIEMEYLDSVPSCIEKENIPLNIIYEDEDLLVVNKAKGMSVHPAPGTPNHTLVNALLNHCQFLSSIGGEDRPGIVHRLDKNTSGLLVVAKNDKCHRLLSEMIQNREISRKYKALVWGIVNFEEAKIDMPIGRDPKDRKKQWVIEDEKHTKRDAVTNVTLLKSFNHFSLLECALETGRTHQIRVHLSYIGYPVVGDPEYKGIKRKIPFQMSKKTEIAFKNLLEQCHGQLLHAYKLEFIHPITGKKMAFEAEMPENFINMLDFLDNNVC